MLALKDETKTAEPTWGGGEGGEEERLDDGDDEVGGRAEDGAAPPALRAHHPTEVQEGPCHVPL